MGFELVKKLKIGYLPIAPDFSAAGDRRRLIYWANSRGHEIVNNPFAKIDVLVASEKSDFNSPALHRGTHPIIFDLIDGYLSPQNQFEDYARGFAKHIIGEISGAVKPFSKHIENMCKLADAVVCSSIEQKRLVARFNQNTHIILDSHHEIPMQTPKAIMAKSKVKKAELLWEGQPATLRGATQIAGLAIALNNDLDITLNFVTDEHYFKYLNRFGDRRTKSFLARNLKGFKEFEVIPWSVPNLIKMSKRSDLSFIPLDLTAHIQTLKPENRLLIMWRLGLPCLTSPSMAYSRVEQETGISIVCQNEDEWFEKASRYIIDKEFARDEVLRGQEYLHKNHSENIILEKWDRVINSLL